MSYKKFCSIVYLCLMLAFTVKASCLEYGHSCWGAHGKRSGSDKAFLTSNDLHNTELGVQSGDADSDINGHRHYLFDNFDVLNAPTDHLRQKPEQQPHLFNSDEDSTSIANGKDITYLAKLLGKPNFKFHTRKNAEDALNGQRDSKLQELVMHGAGRWRNMPYFKFKHFDKTEEDAARSQSQSQHQQKPHGDTKARPDEVTAPGDNDNIDGAFYDFK